MSTTYEQITHEQISGDHKERLHKERLHKERLYKEIVEDGRAISEAVMKPRELQSPVIRFLCDACEIFGIH